MPNYRHENGGEPDHLQLKFCILLYQLSGHA